MMESTVSYLGIEVDDALDGRADRGVGEVVQKRPVQRAPSGQKTDAQNLFRLRLQ